MIIARIVGTVVSTQKDERLQGKKLLIVRPINVDGTDTTVNDEAPEKKGFEFAVRWSRPFPFLDIEGFTLYAEAGWEDYTNNDDPRFVYDRINAVVGVRQEF